MIGCFFLPPERRRTASRRGKIPSGGGRRCLKICKKLHDFLQNFTDDGLRTVDSSAVFLKQFQRQRVLLTAEKFIQSFHEQIVLTDLGKQGQAGAEFHIVRPAEHTGRVRLRQGQHRCGDLPEQGPSTGWSRYTLASARSSSP